MDSFHWQPTLCYSFSNTCLCTTSILLLVSMVSCDLHDHKSIASHTAISRSYQICKSPFSLWKLGFTFEYFTEICTFNHGHRLVFPCVTHPFLELRVQLSSSSHAEDHWDLYIFCMQGWILWVFLFIFKFFFVKALIWT